MRHAIRLFFIVAFLFNTAAFAAVPKDLQASLQQQFAQMKTQAKGRVITDSDLKVDGDTIIYPAMKVMVADMKSYWLIPSMTLAFTGQAKDGKVPFTLQLPSVYSQLLTNGQVLRNVTLSGQTLSGDWSVKENTIARLDGKLSSVEWNDLTFGTVTTAHDIAIQALSTFVPGDKVNMLVHVQTKQFTRLPEGFTTMLLPLQSSMIGQIKSLPKALVVFGAVVPIPGLQNMLAQMGTQIDIDELNMTTANGASLKGNGWFKAAKTDSPLPVSGRMNIEWQNLQQVLTALQQGFSAGVVDRGQTAQSMVVLMMLQGMGTAVGQTTRYTVDLTADGQIMLNGKDVTAMFLGNHSMMNVFTPKEKHPADLPKIPLTKVTDEGNI